MSTADLAGPADLPYKAVGEVAAVDRLRKHLRTALSEQLSQRIRSDEVAGRPPMDAQQRRRFAEAVLTEPPGDASATNDTLQLSSSQQFSLQPAVPPPQPADALPPAFHPALSAEAPPSPWNFTAAPAAPGAPGISRLSGKPPAAHFAATVMPFSL